MALKNYSIRLDEEEYNNLKVNLKRFHDADVNVGFVLRQYIRDLNWVIPELSEKDLRLSFHTGLFASMVGSLLKNAKMIADDWVPTREKKGSEVRAEKKRTK
jgi:hypothetical protein